MTISNAKLEEAGHQYRSATKRIVAFRDGRLLRRALAEYIAESEHQGWEGYTRRDIIAIAAFLEDFALALENGCGTGGYSTVDIEYGIEEE